MKVSETLLELLDFSLTIWEVKLLLEYINLITILIESLLEDNLIKLTILLPIILTNTVKFKELDNTSLNKKKKFLISMNKPDKKLSP